MRQRIVSNIATFSFLVLLSIIILVVVGINAASSNRYQATPAPQAVETPTVEVTSVLLGTEPAPNNRPAAPTYQATQNPFVCDLNFDVEGSTISTSVDCHDKAQDLTVTLWVNQVAIQSRAGTTISLTDAIEVFFEKGPNEVCLSAQSNRTGTVATACRIIQIENE